MTKKTPRHFDPNLGENRAIPRRDFLQGALIGAATTLTGPLLKAYGADMEGAMPAQDRPGYYPPLLTGLRGSHPGAFENAHALRDGRQPDTGSDTGEMYDLVVVGGGISGLSAAHFYRARTSPSARLSVPTSSWSSRNLCSVWSQKRLCRRKRDRTSCA